MGCRLRRRTNMLPLPWGAVGDQIGWDARYRMVSDMVGNHEHLGQYDSYGNHFSIMKWSAQDLRDRGVKIAGNKDRYVIVSHDEDWNDFDAGGDLTAKEACRLINRYESMMRDAQ